MIRKQVTNQYVYCDPIQEKKQMVYTTILILFLCSLRSYKVKGVGLGKVRAMGGETVQVYCLDLLMIILLI